MSYKMGKERRKIRTPKNTKIVRKDLDPGILGEANMDGSIFIDKDVPKGSALEKRVIRHESVHAKEMKQGKIAYGDDYVRDGNKTYHRKDGKIKYNGKWHEEGSNVFPWEKRAKKAE
jgi:hypothetical protein|tara:strand:- start:137 stop:487 length:351 start_codon:yes stop_codon:yes gene_type:complete